MRQITVLQAQAPGFSELRLMIVEAETCCRAGAARHGNLQFQLQCLLELARRHHCTRTAEERVVGNRDRPGECKSVHCGLSTLNPSFSECHHGLCRSDGDEFVLAEHLHPCGIT
jgi:hypothetical protein